MHRKYVGRTEKTHDYRKSSRDYRAGDELYATDISNKKAAIAAQQDIEEFLKENNVQQAART